MYLNQIKTLAGQSEATIVKELQLNQLLDT